MFKIGQSLGDYAVLQELGKGGFGHVYKVEHTITGRREAMKVLAASSADAEQSERFLREIRLQASLSHPNIAVVHTAFWVNDDLALVCEFLEGESLQALLERGKPSHQRALEITGQVLDALSYAHARGIVHRDISPANIFVTANGNIKIIDFGLAKAATDLRLTREGSPIGAAHYMSPEQIRGAQDIDARTDIYSCGVVLYELVAGKKPFEGDNAFDIMKAHTEAIPPSPQTADPQIPADLSGITLRALAKKPEERFQSADAFLQAVRGLQAAPVKAGNQRFPKQRVLAAAAVALMIAIGALVAAMKSNRFQAQAETTKSVAVPPPPPVEAIPPSQPVVIPKAAAPRVRARKTAPTRVAKAAPPVNAATPDSIVQPTGQKDLGDSIPVPPTVEAPAEAKSRNPVVKLGGVLKRMNPLRQNNSAEHKDDKKN